MRLIGASRPGGDEHDGVGVEAELGASLGARVAGELVQVQAAAGSR